MHFELPLSEEKVKRQQVIALHLIVIFTFIASGAFLLLVQYMLSKLSDSQPHPVLLANVPDVAGGFLVVAGIVFFGILLFRHKWLMEKKVNRIARAVELLLLLCLASFAIMNNLWFPAAIYGLVAGAVFFAIYWESISDSTLYIEINERGIRLPVNSRKRFLQWWEVENVLFRFGVLTIDCYDNRLFQWNIKSINFDKENFQRFCLEHIAANKEKRVKYVW